MKVVYVAHPLGHGEDREANRAEAAKWVAHLALVADVAPVADWIILSGEWPESMREHGLAIDKALIERCDGIALCGPRVSSGMQIELEHAMSRGLRVFRLEGKGTAELDELRAWAKEP